WHRLTVRHPVAGGVPVLGMLFNVGDWPMGGGVTTPQAMAFDPASGRAVHGASWRTVVDLAGGRSWDALLPGNSGHVLSPHYRDQAETWLAGRLAEQQWRPDEYRRSPLLPGDAGHVLSAHDRDQAETWLAARLAEQQWRPDEYRRSPLLRLLPP